MIEGMDRREFIRRASAGSAVLAGSSVLAGASVSGV